MKIFANKNIWRKIVIVFLLISVFSFVAPEPVEAKKTDMSVGGTLMEPICDLLVGACDGVINIIHKILIKQDLTLIKVNLNSGLLTFLRIALTILVAIGVTALIVAGGGFAIAAVVAKIGLTVTFSTLVSLTSLGLISGIYVGAQVYSIDGWDNRVDIPVYSISPEEIFRNDIPLFNVNFFSPDERTVNYSWLSEFELPSFGAGTFVTSDSTISGLNGKLQGYPFDYDDIVNYSDSNGLTENEENELNGLVTTITKYYIVVEQEGTYQGTYQLTDTHDTSAGIDNHVYELRHNTEVAGNYAEKNIYSYSHQLRNVVSTWYFRLLLVAVIGMMSVLVYIGIRILLSSTSSSQKAKYKQMLGDWLVGMVLLFTMHFIMAFSNMFVDKLTDLLGSVNPRVYFDYLEEDKNGKIEKALDQTGFIVVTDKEAGDQGITIDADHPQYVLKHTDTSGKVYFQMQTNLMGQLRYNARFNKEHEVYVGYTVLFIIMTIYLIIYIFTYLRRLVYMVFLTMIAPLVALTYPIDKANDGKAQGFSIWFKEYIFNLLIQPLHLLLYTILISSAINLATENMIYAIVVIGFMAPAEKLLRQMFNFQKASTPGVFGGAAGGALVMSGMRWIMGHGPKGGPMGKEKNGLERDENGNIISSTSRRAFDINAQMGGDKASQKAKNVKKSADEQQTTKPKETQPKPLNPSGKDNGSANSNNSEGGGLGSGADIDMQGPKPDAEPPTGGANEESSYEDFMNDYVNDNMMDTGIEYETPYHESDMEGNEEPQSFQDLINEEVYGNRPEPSYEDLMNDYIDNNRGEAEWHDKEDNRTGWQKFKDGLAEGRSTYVDGLKGRFTRSLVSGAPIRRLGRMGLGAAGMAALGTVGLAAGATTGDAGKAAQYAGAGVAGGMRFGSNSYDGIEKLIKSLGVEGAGDQASRAYYGEEESQRRKAEKNQLRAMQDEANIRILQEKLKISRKEAKERLQESIPFYYDNKVTDMKEIAKMEKVVKKDKALQKQLESIEKNQSMSKESKEEAKRAAMQKVRDKAYMGYYLNQQYSISNKTGEEKRKSVREQMGVDYGWTDDQAKIFMKYADDYNKVNNNM